MKKIWGRSRVLLRVYRNDSYNSHEFSRPRKLSNLSCKLNTTVITSNVYMRPYRNIAICQDLHWVCITMYCFVLISTVHTGSYSVVTREPCPTLPCIHQVYNIKYTDSALNILYNVHAGLLVLKDVSVKMWPNCGTQTVALVQYAKSLQFAKPFISVMVSSSNLPVYISAECTARLNADYMLGVVAQDLPV